MDLKRVNRSIPESVGRYRLESMLGKGGMVEVYGAYDESLQRRVAIKHIRADRQESAQARQRLLREARAIAAISHPAIVQIYDFLETAAGDWIVMELVEGPTVAEILRQGPLDLAKALELGRQVTAGLAFAHERGFVHRDLKAENVILSPDRGARILDFGLCKQMARQGSDSSLTLENAVIGTCRAMSPEQAQGLSADARSDLFSLGVLLYECLSGFSPFAEKSALATLRQVCTLQQQPLHEVDPDLPLALSQLVDCLLQKLPEHRPASAAVVATRLDGIAQDLTGSSAAKDSTGPVAEQAIDMDDLPTRDWSLARPATIAWRVSTMLTRGQRWTWAVPLIALTLAAGIGHRVISRSDIAIAATSKALPNDATKSVLQGFELMRFSYRETQVEQAIELFDHALQLGGPDARALTGLCEAYIARYNRDRDPLWLDRAAEHARRAVELENQLARARACLGDVLLGQGQSEKALSEVDEAIALKPLSADHHALRGLVLFELDRYDEARQAFGRAIEIDAGSWFAHDALGYLELRLGEDEAAIESLVQAVRLAPDNAIAHKNLGVAYFRLGRMDEAATQFQRSLEIEPLHRTYTNLGTLEFYRGRYQAALAAFEQAVKSGAHHYLNWANLGDAQRFAPGQRAAASESFQRAIQLLEDDLARRPQDPDLRSRLALFWAKLGEVSVSLRELDRLDLEHVENPRVLYRVVQALEISGQREQALEVLDSAFASGLSPTEVSRDPELTELRQDARYHRLVAPFYDGALKTIAYLQSE